MKVHRYLDSCGACMYCGAEWSPDAVLFGTCESAPHLRPGRNAKLDGPHCAVNSETGDVCQSCQHEEQARHAADVFNAQEVRYGRRPIYRYECRK